VARRVGRARGLVERHRRVGGARQQHPPHVARLLAPQRRKDRIGKKDVRMVATGHGLGIPAPEGGVELANEGFVGVHGIDPSQGRVILPVSILGATPEEIPPKCPLSPPNRRKRRALSPATSKSPRSPRCCASAKSPRSSASPKTRWCLTATTRPRYRSTTSPR